MGRSNYRTADVVAARHAEVAHTVWRRLFCTPPLRPEAGRARREWLLCHKCGPHIHCAVPYPTELVHLIRVLGQSEAALDVFPVTSPFCRLTPAFSLSWPSSLFLPHLPPGSCSDLLISSGLHRLPLRLLYCFRCANTRGLPPILLSLSLENLRLTPPLLQRHISSVSFVSGPPRCSESPRKPSNAAELQPEASSRQPTLPSPKDQAARDNSLHPLVRACALL